jgi:predicted nucleic acid-binding Zn finger protein
MKNSKMVVNLKEVDSVTRKTTEQMKLRFHATYCEVKSASKQKYIVTKTSCTCPDHFYRGKNCRHMQAVHDTVQTLKFWK